MNHSRSIQPTAGMSLSDLYYVVFRHQWKIVSLSLAGILAAGLFYLLKAPPYQSQAELLIQYVSQARSLSLAGRDSRIIVPDAGGAGVISAEIQILTSLDVAKTAAGNLGAAKILAKFGGGDDVIKAATLIQGNLQARPADRDSGVIVVTFKHPDRQIVQPVLQEVITEYFQKHHEIHSAAGPYAEALSKEGAALKEQLNETEKQLAGLKNQARIISLDQSRNGLATQISRIQDAVLDAQAELAGYEAVIKQLDYAPGLKSAATNAVTLTPVPPEQMEAYSDAADRLQMLRREKQGYLVQGFTRDNKLVQEVNNLIAGTLKTLADLRQKYPQIVDLKSTVPLARATSETSFLDPQVQQTQVTVLRAKLKAWGTQLEQLQTQATNLNSLALTISQLERTKAIQQENYQNLAIKLENFHIDQALDTGKTPNIKWIQTPTPPFQESGKILKKAALLACAGIFAGFGWAFLMELYLDRTLKRPREIQARLHLPLLLSIPEVGRNGHPHSLLSITSARRLLSSPATGGDDSSGSSDFPVENVTALEVVSREQNSRLKPFYEALRDRLIVHFEIKNLKHKPKLVAVTSANEGAGVSTMAAGLAASLSETGDGNVLLVDMNLRNGAAQHFYQGKAGYGLEIALEKTTREQALVQDNLYVVTGNSKHYELSRILPKRFAALVPKFEASEYDYIIFDMPPVSQTSITARLAQFMDMVLLVIESEKTDREVAQHANSWLAESGASIGAVLNKTRKHVPARLLKEFTEELPIRD
jgi:uncharacterized protein involved in exopolysaccharide biosynthesis/Mrp family chromosome partitioning ATPase